MTEQPEHYDTNSLRPLDIRYSNPITRKAWDILQRAQKEEFVLDMASQLAELDGYNMPETPEEVLWWLMSEAQGFEERGRTYIQSDDSDERVDNIICNFLASTTLRRYAIELLQVGIQPMLPTKRGE